jgi:hypothetical protein
MKATRSTNASRATPALPALITILIIYAAGGHALMGQSTIDIKRIVRSQTGQVPLFGVALAAKSSFNMNGKNCLVNSFNSATTNYSTPVSMAAPFTNYTINTYTPSNVEPLGGDVAVDGAVVGDASLGNGTIDGHLYTGPGGLSTDVQMGPNGSVGSTSWTASNTGVEGSGTGSSYWQPTFNVNFPDVAAPAPGVSLPAPLASGPFSGYVSIPQGAAITSYTAASGFSTALLITGPTTLWVQGSMTLPSIVIAPTNNATLTLYVGTTTGSGDSISLGGSSLVNQPGYARNLIIYGLPSLNSISMSGNAGWNACVYAPDADFSGGGGGSNTQDSQGSLVCRSFTASGHWNFHFDQSLLTNGPSRGWVANSWAEK